MYILRKYCLVSQAVVLTITRGKTALRNFVAKNTQSRKSTDQDFQSPTLVYFNILP